MRYISYTHAMSTLTTQPALADDYVDLATTACKHGDVPTALDLLARAIASDASNESAWLWLSGLVESDAERRFCLNRVLQINPHAAAARHGLKLLSADCKAQPPYAALAHHHERCCFPGCAATHRINAPYCLSHWMAIYRSVAVRELPPRVKPLPPTLSASALAARLAVSTPVLLAACTELGWIERGAQGWLATASGQALGAVQQIHPQSGVPFVHWPATILDHPALPRTLRPDQPCQGGERSLREQFPATLRANDGHSVRTQAELLIDNWLYGAALAHAYEWALPTPEAAICDFFVPCGRVVIEYWGQECGPARMAHAVGKRDLYARHAFNLIALDDAHLADLNAFLPVLLAQFGAR